MDTLVSYYIPGLNNNEFCVWISGDFIDKQYVEKMLFERIPGFDAHVKEGRFELWSCQDWYLEGGAFSGKRVMNKWMEKCKEISMRKFDGLRVSADTTWVTAGYWDQWILYEADVSKAISQYPILALCNYYLGAQKPDKLIDTMLAHQAAVLHKDKRVRVVANSVNGRIVRKLEEKILALEELNRSYLSRPRA